LILIAHCTNVIDELVAFIIMTTMNTKAAQPYVAMPIYVLCIPCQATCFQKSTFYASIKIFKFPA